MRCPKCNNDIDDNAIVCPNCKKVLKLICPICKAINKTNTCKKCGFVIVTKCHKCGKINKTIDGTCKSCGFNNYTSVAINSSNIDEFACLTVEFPNINEIKSALGSTKLFEKFKANLDKLIYDYTESVGLKRQIIDKVYVIRFNKDFSFTESANNAVKSAIEIQNLVIELNFKLEKLKNSSLECRIAVLKRDIYSQQSDYKSGFDIKLIYQNKKDLKLLNNLQIITDSSIYEAVSDNYALSTLATSQIKGEFMMFFELNLKKYIKIPHEKPAEELEEKIELPKFEEEQTNKKEAEEDNIYNIESINFEELKCNFINTKSIDLIPEILEHIKNNDKNIISVKCKKKLQPQTCKLIKALEESGIYNRVYRVTCHDEMKYKPYGFFYELIASIFDYSQSTKNFVKHNFNIFDKVDPSGFVKDLINLNKREFPHPEDVRYSLFDIFLNIFYSMPKSLVYIENFEKIDDTSLEFLQLVFSKFDELGASYLVVGEDFSLHKDSHELLTKPNYTEITLKETKFAEILGQNVKKYEKILDSYYIQKISQNTKGSPLYFDLAMEYLLECNLIEFNEDSYSVINFENILIPTTLEDLVAKRFKHLSKELSENKLTYNIFGMLLFIGPRIDFGTLSLLDIPNYEEEIQKLIDKNYLYIHNSSIYIQNYNLYKAVFLKTTTLSEKQAIASELIQKLYSVETASPTEAILYNILEQEKNEFLVWEKLSQLNTSMGDFSAYLNCSIKFLKLINNHIDENSQKTIDEYKMEVYENLSNLLYKYTPDKIQNIAQIILENLEKTTDDKKVINLCNKMLQGCLISGNYSHALRLIHKILSKFPKASLNPKDKHFNPAFFLINLIKIEVLFSIGDLKDCIESGDEILEILNPKNIEELKPNHLSVGQFEDVIFDTMGFVAISRIMMLKSDLNEFLYKVQRNLGKIPTSYELFILLEKAIHGEGIQLDSIALEDDKFSKIIFNIAKAILDKDDYKKLASDIYQAKINAKLHKLNQIELICDLLIGYSYFKLKEDRKASSIYYNVLETSTKNGLKTVTYIAWYLISVLKLEQNETDVAFGIANNASIKLEKDENSSEFLLFLFKTVLANILTAKNEPQKAQLCLNHAKFIKEKYGFEI